MTIKDDVSRVVNGFKLSEEDFIAHLNKLMNIKPETTAKRDRSKGFDFDEMNKKAPSTHPLPKNYD